MATYFMYTDFSYLRRLLFIVKQLLQLYLIKY